MNESKLSPPLLITGSTVIDKVNNVESIFNSVFGKKQVRPHFNGKFIFFNTNKEYKGQHLIFPERFMHICSIEDKTSYTIFPCNNDVTYTLCQNKCVHPEAHPEFKKINRNECFYRMARIHWIPEIINLANNADPDIQIWTKSKRNKRGSLDYQCYIRYVSGIDDYVLILKEDRRHGEIYKYDFVTSFPVFTKRNKTQYTEDYLRYKKSAVLSTSTH